MKTPTLSHPESRPSDGSSPRPAATVQRAPTMTPAGLQRVDAGLAMHLGPFGGELTVVSGRVWLTRSGDLGDHVLEAGERLRLAAAENAVIEPWDAGQEAMVRWSPRHASFAAALLAEPLRVFAFLLQRSLAAGASRIGKITLRRHGGPAA